VGEPLRECGFSERRFDVALEFYRNKIGYTRDVFLLVWDATALLPALGYQSATDTVVGLTVSDELLAQIDLRVGESLEAFLKRISSLQLATQVEIVLLVPLEPRRPPFLLAAFAQSGPQTMETLKQRMHIARSEMEKRGAFIVGVAADGATGNFKLMRQMRQPLPGAPTIAIAGVPTLSGAATTAVHLPARGVAFHGAKYLVPDLAIVDPVHLPNLLRNAPLRKSAAMRVGNHDISQQRVYLALRERMGDFGMEPQLGVRVTDFNVSDRMNFASAQRLFSTKLLAYLETHFGSNPTFTGACAALLCCVLFLFLSSLTDAMLRRSLLVSALQPRHPHLHGPVADAAAASSLPSTPCSPWRRGTQTCASSARLPRSRSAPPRQRSRSASVESGAGRWRNTRRRRRSSRSRRARNRRLPHQPRQQLHRRWASATSALVQQQQCQQQPQWRQRRVGRRWSRSTLVLHHWYEGGRGLVFERNTHSL